MSILGLSDSITRYYQSHFDELSTDKQFHFASRMYSWAGDPWSRNILEQHRSRFELEAIEIELKELLTNPYEVSHTIHAYDLRKAYFKKYPLLVGLERSLFILRHAYYFYSIDARPIFYRYISKDTMQKLKMALLSDPAGVAILSTYAVNVIYLIERFIFEEDETNVYALLAACDEYYDLTNPTHIQLFLYLHTHCVISESLFYGRNISHRRREEFTASLQKMDDIIRQNFTTISLDNKLEYLVSCRLSEWQSSLCDDIFRECEASVSPNGSFVIDTKNTYAGRRAANISNAEHRNVLFIMSTTEQTLPVSRIS